MVKYHIEINLKETIHALIISDILIMSKSSMSYSIAILSKSKFIYYIQFYHRPLNNWIVVNSNYNKWWQNGQIEYNNWWNERNCSKKNSRNIKNGIIYNNINCEC